VQPLLRLRLCTFLCVSCVLFLFVFGLLVFGVFVLWDDFVLVLFFFVDAKFFLQVVWRVGVGLCVLFAFSKASHLRLAWRYVCAQTNLVSVKLVRFYR